MRYFILAVVSALILIGCSENDKKDVLFTKLDSKRTGVEFANNLSPRGDLNIIEYLYFYNGGGVAVADLNNDGLEDLVFTGNQSSNKVYINKGELVFQEIELDYPFESTEKWSTGVTTADVNEDGFQDIYICQVGNYKSLSGRNLLYINNGDETFTEAAEQYGINFSGFSTHSAFFDYDKDGDLDLYLLNHAVHTTRSYKRAETRANYDSLSGDRLYKNLSVETGEVKFADVSQTAGIYSSPQGYGLGLVVSDLNADGWPDIYVGNDFHENDYLYINQKDGTFREALEEQFQHTSRFTMGVDVADINDDALPDVMGLDMLPADEKILMKSGGEDANKVAEIKLKYGYHHQVARNVLQINNGNGTFTDVALQENVYATDWSWSTLINDFDNDGRKDIFISNGIFKRPNDLDYINYLSNTNLSLYTASEQDSIEEILIEKMPAIKIPNYVFKNLGNIRFKEVSDEWGLGDDTYSNGTAYADLDNDGDLELIINNVNDKASIYQNDASTSGNFMSIKLLGDKRNTRGIGSRVFTYVAGTLSFQEVYPVRGFQSSVSTNLHFGLDSAKLVDSLMVIWPDQRVSREYNIAANSRITINYEEADEIDFAVEDLKTELDYDIQKLDFEHKEDRFNDYDREKLIPHKTSTQGPALAVGDINRDGLRDFYIGGAHNQSGAIFLSLAEGEFKKIQQDVFDADAASEDVDAEFVDLDGDGDLDLYVVSGGGYYPEGAAVMQDRIYINDGSGRFSRLDIKTPRTNGSTVLAADFDLDEDIDLFVGTYSIPGSYGVSSRSYFLINNGNLDFTQLPVSLGMIKDAIFEDVRAIGKKELVLAGEWMPVSLFTYENNGWINLTDSLDLEFTNGWWNALTFDDRIPDSPKLWAANLGLNAKIKATPEKPVSLYLGDFDNNGQVDPILFYYKQGVSIPFMSKDELAGQLPGLKKDFLSYSDFSKVDTIEKLIASLPNHRYDVKNAYHFAHTIFEFDQEIHTQEPMNRIIQRTYLNDIAISNESVAYAGNFFGPVANFGRYDAAGLLIAKPNQFINIREFKDRQVMEVEWLNENLLLVVTNDDGTYLLRIDPNM